MARTNTHTRGPTRAPTLLGAHQIKQVAGEFQMATAGKAATIGGMQVGHVAHLAGAAVGVLLVLALARLPEPQEGGV